MGGITRVCNLSVGSVKAIFQAKLKYWPCLLTLVSLPHVILPVKHKWRIFSRSTVVYSYGNHFMTFTDSYH